MYHRRLSNKRGSKGKVSSTTASFPTKAKVVAISFPIICLIVIFFNHTRNEHTKSIELAYCGDGHFFTFLVSMLTDILSKRSMRIQVVEHKPDIVLASTGDSCLQWKGIPRITVLGENIQNDQQMYLQDLSEISTLLLHCVKINITLQNMHYYPFWVTSFGERRVHKPRDLIRRSNGADILRQKSRFCAFMYSHASPARDRLFNLINRYKAVDVLGPYPDFGQKTDRFVYNDNVTFYDLAVEHYKPYKFVISGENSPGSGYITEKIVNAMLANSIPIYIGAPDIIDTFNPESFLNANTMTDEDLLHALTKLDEDDAAYVDMLNKYWFPENKLPGWFNPSNFSELMRPVIERLH